MGLLDNVMGPGKPPRLYKVTIKAGGKSRTWTSTDISKEGMTIDNALHIIKTNVKDHKKIEIILERVSP